MKGAETMNRSQLEKIYQDNGLKNYKLRTTEDLFNVHGIDFKAVEGYDRLDEANKAIYERFIINFFNGQGLDYRDIVPKGIDFVEDVQLLIKENETDDHFTVAGNTVKAIDKDGIKTVLHDWLYEDYKGLKVTQDEPYLYLRCEYEHQGRSKWLHVTHEGTQWY
jgi:hypothetical protein